MYDNCDKLTLWRVDWQPSELTFAFALTASKCLFNATVNKVDIYLTFSRLAFVRFVIIDCSLPCQLPWLTVHHCCAIICAMAFRLTGLYHRFMPSLCKFMLYLNFKCSFPVVSFRIIYNIIVVVLTIVWIKFLLDLDICIHHGDNVTDWDCSVTVLCSWTKNWWV